MFPTNFVHLKTTATKTKQKYHFIFIKGMLVCFHINNARKCILIETIKYFKLKLNTALKEEKLQQLQKHLTKATALLKSPALKSLNKFVHLSNVQNLI